MNTKFSLLLILLLGFFVSPLSANNDKNKPLILVKTNPSDIENALQEARDLSNFIDANGLNFDALKEVSPEMVSSTNLSVSASEDYFFKGGSGAPLGIPGIVWGFCLGLIGVLIVYIAMGEGGDRKKQVRMSLIGCLIGAALSGAYYLIVDNDTQNIKQDKMEYNILLEERA